MGNEIHVYFHIVTEPDDQDVALLKATIAVLEARLAAEVPTVADLAALDVLVTRLKGLATVIDAPIP